MKIKNTKQKTREVSDLVPKTLTVPNAARSLDIHPATLHMKIKTGVLTGIYQGGKGVGKRVKVYADEIALYAAGQMDALRQLVYERSKGGRGR